MKNRNLPACPAFITRSELQPGADQRLARLTDLCRFIALDGQDVEQASDPLATEIGQQITQAVQFGNDYRAAQLLREYVQPPIKRTGYSGRTAIHPTLGRTIRLDSMSPAGGGIGSLRDYLPGVTNITLKGHNRDLGLVGDQIDNAVDTDAEQLARDLGQNSVENLKHLLRDWIRRDPNLTDFVDEALKRIRRLPNGGGPREL